MAISTAAICGCSFSIIAAISVASSQSSRSISHAASGGVIRASTLSAFSGPSARFITASICGRGIEADRGALAGVADEIVEHVLDLVLR